MRAILLLLKISLLNKLLLLLLLLLLKKSLLKLPRLKNLLLPSLLLVSNWRQCYMLDHVSLIMLVLFITAPKPEQPKPGM